MTVRAVFRRTVGAQWPILLVGSIFAVGFVLAGANFWRRGALLIGIGVGVAAVLRLVLSEERGRPVGGAQQGDRFRDDRDGRGGHGLHRIHDRSVRDRLGAAHA
ncbi:Conserved membrane protein of uncharacterised function [Mycobacterium tuberculosis]|nr:Conserved membrane protein of uncharacterised function [Mycobacterium tuberculosis]